MKKKTDKSLVEQSDVVIIPNMPMPKLYFSEIWGYLDATEIERMKAIGITVGLPPGGTRAIATTGGKGEEMVNTKIVRESADGLVEETWWFARDGDAIRVTAWQRYARHFKDSIIAKQQGALHNSLPEFEQMLALVQPPADVWDEVRTRLY